MYNKVIMLGRVTQDLSLKTTPSGKSVLTFSIAVDRRFQTKGEDRKSDFFNCVAWGQTADFISRFWSKGQPILIEGELQNRSYDDKDGKKHTVTEIIVDRASFTGANRAESKPEEQPAPAAPETEKAPNVTVPAPDDDYPF